jgi:hypothetical protein
MARLHTKSDLLKIASVVATIPACFLLFSGGYVLAHFGAAYTARDLILFGGFPLVGGLCWLILAAWFWSRAVGAESAWDCIGLVSLRALGAIALAVVASVLLGQVRGH